MDKNISLPEGLLKDSTWIVSNSIECTLGLLATAVFSYLNLVILLTFFRAKKHIGRTTISFLVNIVIIDLLSSIFVLPVAVAISIIKEFIALPQTVCFYWLSLGSLLFSARMFGLFGITLDRYLSVCYAMQYTRIMTLQRTRFGLQIFWILSSVLTLPHIASTIVNGDFLQPGEDTMITSSTAPQYWNCLAPDGIRQGGSTVAASLLTCLLFIFRFIVPLMLASALHFQTFRVLSESNAGFKRGVLQVQPTYFTTDSNDQISCGSMADCSTKPFIMRIHRGNYMKYKSQDLFAQLPHTIPKRHVQCRQSSRRTAVLPYQVEVNGCVKKHVYEPDSKGGNDFVQAKSEDVSVNDAEIVLAQIPASADNCMQTSVTNVQQTVATKHVSVLKVRWKRIKDATQRRIRVKRSTAILPLTLLLFFTALLWLPNQVFQLLDMFAFNLAETGLRAYFYWLGCLSLFVNPIILAFWSPSCHTRFVEIITCGRVHQNDVGIKRLIIASLGTANLPIGQTIRPPSVRK